MYVRGFYRERVAVRASPKMHSNFTRLAWPVLIPGLKNSWSIFTRAPIPEVTGS